jgi:hypothetical protein
MKTCEWCGEVFSPKRKDTRFCCKSCKKEGNKAYYRARYNDNKSRFRDNRLQKKFGITLEDYNQMFAEQEGCCLICGIHQAEVKERFAVDHCHTTGKVRGLLCSHCNLGLGHFRDNIESLAKAIAYLERSK